MAQNFLYMFEFVVDDLLVTRPNFCAPAEYPTCCEISFRNSVFVSICDREFGHCVDPTAAKCGKCCLFSLDTPISETDRLLIHIYKKKTDKCKFLVGCTDMPIRGLFDKVMESFNIENANWEDTLRKHTQTLPKAGAPKVPEIVDNDCDEDTDGRPEQMCPTSELTKRLLPLFNLKGCQTGNVVLIIRLVANGPSIVSTFPFGKICNAGCCKKPPACADDANKAPAAKTCGRVGGGGNDQPFIMDSLRCDGGTDTLEPAANDRKCGGSKAHKNQQNSCNGCRPQKDPCLKVEKKYPCQRYFACNADKGCPCDDVEDECARAPKCMQQMCNLQTCNPSCCPPPAVPPPPSCCNQDQSQPTSQSTGDCSCDDCMNQCDAGPASCSADTCDDTVKDPCNPCGQCMQPCFVTPRPPEPSPDAFDEFEACLNGSGLVIRVLKDRHCVESVCDGTEEFHDDNSSECCDEKPTEKKEKDQYPSFARNYIKRRTGGHIINHPKLPKIRANIKYSGNDTCCPLDYHVPYSNIKKFCNEQENKVNSYRSRRQRSRGGSCSQDCGPSCKPLHPDDNRNCCIQVDKDDIRNTMRGMTMDNRKKGIEVCYKTCDETDTDVFLVKLGSKQKCQHKKNIIEVELKTPKVPIVLTNRRVTTETQINEVELDAALSDVCKGKKGKKGKNGKH